MHRVRRRLGIFLLSMRRNSVNSASGLKTACRHHHIRRPQLSISGNTFGDMISG